jgi:hypothetical protein
MEREYWKLILHAVPTVEACRQTGMAAKPAIGGTPNQVAYRRCEWLSRNTRRGI